MKIVLLGAGGQLGRQLKRSLAPLGELTALTRQGLAHEPTGQSAPGLWCGDLCQSAALAQTLRQLRPDVVVNAAAYTQVDAAQTQAVAAHAVNAQACALLAHETRQLGAWLVHFSTDYVFSGTGQRPWHEGDACQPLNVYGQSKRDGELSIAAQSSRYWILRSSWLYEQGNPNFLTTLLRSALQGQPLAVVDNQWGTPTRAAWLADVTAQMLRNQFSQQRCTPAGTYHVAAAGYTQRLAYARFALEQARQMGALLLTTAAHITPSRLAQWGGAPRPANTRLDCTRWQAATGIKAPHWQDGVRDVVALWARQLQATAPCR